MNIYKQLFKFLSLSLILGLAGNTYTADSQAFTPISDIDHGPTNDPLLEQLWNEIQTDMNIKPQVPIRWAALSKMPNNLISAAQTDDKGVYINRDYYMTTLKSDLKQFRILLFHEAVHVQQNQQVGTLTNLGKIILSALPLSIVVSIFGEKYIGDFKYSLIGGLSFATTFCLFHKRDLFFNQKLYGPLSEREADIKGFTATQCEECVKVHRYRPSQILLHKKELTPSEAQKLVTLKAGYISHEECSAIVEKLKGKRCKYHAAGTSNQDS